MPHLQSASCSTVKKALSLPFEQIANRPLPVAFVRLHHAGFQQTVLYALPLYGGNHRLELLVNQGGYQHHKGQPLRFVKWRSDTSAASTA